MLGMSVQTARHCCSSGIMQTDQVSSTNETCRILSYRVLRHAASTQSASMQTSAHPLSDGWRHTFDVARDVERAGMTFIDAQRMIAQETRCNTDLSCDGQAKSRAAGSRIHTQATVVVSSFGSHVRVLAYPCPHAINHSVCTSDCDSTRQRSDR